MDKARCSVVEDGEQCPEPAKAKGMCGKHYQRQQRQGDPLVNLKPQGRLCSVPGCGKPHRARGYCLNHDRQMQLYGTIADPYERKFWAQVNRSAGLDGCWPWTGYVAPTGYGQFGSRSERLPHRIAYEFTIGPIPAGAVLDHLCHTREPQCADTVNCLHRRCCNPRHLEPVTQRENIARGRGGDSWGYVPEAVPAKPIQLTLPMCAKCGRTDKPVYKSGMCRPCYRRWLKDPAVERPSQRTPEQRFWLKVNKRGPLPLHVPELGRCWLWTASVNAKTGYGQFARRHGEPVDAHRFSYALANGEIPAGHDVHHKCHRRDCVNPGHLEALSRSDNLRLRKNRRDSA